MPRQGDSGHAGRSLHGRQARDETDKKRAAIEHSINEVIGSYKSKLYDERVAMLPPDVQTIIRKPEKTATESEQKTADDYYPILRIDAGKILEVMPAAEADRYRELLRQLDQATSKSTIPAFWTVEVDPQKEREKNYILTSGEADRPEKNHPVEPGWPFAPPKIDFRDGRIEALSGLAYRCRRIRFYAARPGNAVLPGGPTRQAKAKRPKPRPRRSSRKEEARLGRGRAGSARAAPRRRTPRPMPSRKATRARARSPPRGERRGGASADEEQSRGWQRLPRKSDRPVNRSNPAPTTVAGAAGARAPTTASSASAGSACATPRTRATSPE